ncbi:hypothetical protein Chor_013435 [Crotalus horridus]
MLGGEESGQAAAGGGAPVAAASPATEAEAPALAVPAARDAEEKKDEEEDDEAEEEAAAAEAERATRQRYEELCSSLNMDERARAEAWLSYQSMRRNYTLEGNDLHWLACSLYVACRKAVPTVSRGTVEGNYVSLIRILRCSGQSLIEFFNKMKKWEDMADLPSQFRERTTRLERNFTVSAVIFKKYEPIFQDIFKYPQDDQPRQQRGRKQRRQPCTVSEVFQFCWVLFVYAKGNFPMISDDLVNSYHLLLCVLDLVYGNSLQCPNRKEILNPGFKGLPEDFHSKDFKLSSEAPCIIEKLCSLHDGLVLEAKGIKEHFWKPYVKKLFEKKILKGKEENLTGFLDPGNFTESFKAINKAYEEYILSVGNLDERIFLGEDADEEIGTLRRCLNTASEMETAERVQMKYNLQEHFERTKSFRISTPLTGRKYIKDSDPYLSPISIATHCLTRLHTMLAGLKNAPSENLEQILRSVESPSMHFADWGLQDGFKFGQLAEISQALVDFVGKHFRLAEVLYYKVLESVIKQEKKRLEEADLSAILEHDVFHKSLMACCLEVIIYSYKAVDSFPFITDVFDVPAFHFYKVMPPQYFERSNGNSVAGSPLTPRRLSEVRAESGTQGKALSNGELSHTCSALLLDSGTFEELSGFEPFQIALHSFSQLTSRLLFSPPPHPPTAFPLGTSAGVSFSPATLHERYGSPTGNPTRRRLFVDSDTSGEAPRTPVRLCQPPVISTVPIQNVSSETIPVTPVPGQTLVTVATATVTANNGQTVTIPVQGPGWHAGFSADDWRHPPVARPAPAGCPSWRTATKAADQQVFYLASVRLRDLCIRLDISDELRKKIWTCFEFSLVQCVELMMDRHLDQLLMCAIYVIAKVTKEDTSFQNIMRHYRMQPQAKSHVYRSVLIKGRRRRNSGTSDTNNPQASPVEKNKDRTSRDSSPVMRSSSTLPAPQPSSAPPTPTRLTGASSDSEEEERGDLIQFYNNVYTDRIKDFALKYSSANGTDVPPLSPYPFVRSGSPRRIQLSQNHPIYISPHKNECATSRREKIFYYFSSSPSKRLEEINSMIRTGETSTKKRGIVLEEGAESPAKRMCPENHTALLRRLQDVANDRGSH